MRRRALGRHAASLIILSALAASVTAPASASGWPTIRIAGPYVAPTPAQLSVLRLCEASGNYRINTGNGFYGAYQFDLATWHSLGLPGRADQAPAAVQDRAASALEAQRGWGPWPGCARMLGLVAARLTAAVVPVASPVAVLGALSPARAGSLVHGQYYARGWKDFTTGRVGRDGSVRLVARPPVRGVIYLRAYTPSAAGQASSNSLRLTVR